MLATPRNKKEKKNKNPNCPAFPTIQFFADSSADSVPRSAVHAYILCTVYNNYN